MFWYQNRKARVIEVVGEQKELRYENGLSSKTVRQFYCPRTKNNPK
jgi:hypothetical protein